MIENNERMKFLHAKLKNHLNEQSEKYESFIYAKEIGFYQGFDAIKIQGCRSTEKRFEQYKIEKYLSKTKNALDIGCNCGFFSIFISKFLKNIDGIDINPYLIKIGEDVKEFLKIDNIKLHSTSFENFLTNKKYDIIFSLANDETIDGNTKFTFIEYMQKIMDSLTPSGMLVFESQAEDVILHEKFLQKLEILKEKFEIVENRMVDSEYPINVPKRIFLILKQK